MSENLLVSRQMYMKYKIHIGLTEKSNYMLEKYIYKVKENGVAIFNIEKIDEKIVDAVNLISQYEPKEVVFADRRLDILKALNMAEEILGIKSYGGRYLPGTFTNPQYEFFYEPSVVVVFDPFQNPNIIKDSASTNKVVIAFLNSDGVPENIDIVIPGNNRQTQSVVFLIWLLTRELALRWGLISSREGFNYIPEDFAKTTQDE